MKKEFILFDLDGTITDSSAGIINSLIYALEKMGLTYENRENLHQFIGPPIVDMLMQVFGIQRENAEQGLAFYREYYKDKGIFENSVYDGVKEMLDNLQKKGYKLVLATSKPEVYAKRILTYFDLDKYFYFVGGSTLEGTRDSKTDVIKYALESLEISDVSKCIMVGDRKYDVLGSGECKIECVGVLYGYGSREELEKAGAKYIVESVSELSAFLSN